MNRMFDIWLKRDKGISYEDLKHRPEKERMAYWEEYCKHEDDKAEEYNRQLHPHWYD